MSTCTAVIPTFNEREDLPPLVEQLMTIPGVHVLVVDDASPDGTGELSDRLALAFPGRMQVLHRSGKAGFGSAYVAGLQQALTQNSEFIVQMDADLSHEVRFLPTLISAAAAGADLVIGSRYVAGGGVSSWSALRRQLSRFANFYVRTVTKLAVQDCTAGYRCWRREGLMQLPLSSLMAKGYAFQVETAWEASRLGLRITEVPITFVGRRHGESKLTLAVILESVLLPWRLRSRRSTRT